MSLSRYAFVLLGMMVVLVAGCADTTNLRGSVKGKVTVDNQPLKGGKLILRSDEMNYQLAISPSGTFAQPNIKVGEYKVAFDTEYIRNNLQNFMAQLPPGAANDPEVKEEIAALKQYEYVPIPNKYRKPETSGLVWNINAGTNERTFNLEKK